MIDSQGNKLCFPNIDLAHFSAAAGDKKVQKLYPNFMISNDEPSSIGTLIFMTNSLEKG